MGGPPHNCAGTLSPPLVHGLWHTRLLLLCVATAALAAPADTLAGLRRAFEAPPDDAHIMMRWWWFRPSVTKPEPEREMKTMQAGGIGTLAFTPGKARELAIRRDWADERYLSPIRDWARKHGTRCRSQSYRTPPVALSSNALVDVVEGRRHTRRIRPTVGRDVGSRAAHRGEPVEGGALLLHGGGPTQVMNASLAGVVEESRLWPECRRCLARVSGSKAYWPRTLRPGSADASARRGDCAHAGLRARLLAVARRPPDYQRLVEILGRRGIRFFFQWRQRLDVHGASDCPSRGRDGYELRVIGIPKTIDNDLGGTDHSPGYGSTALVLRVRAARDIGEDIRALRGRVTVVEVMGRNAGWLTAATVFARNRKEDPPHLIYLPERPLSRARFLADVEIGVPQAWHCGGGGMRGNEGRARLSHWRSGDTRRIRSPVERQPRAHTGAPGDRRVKLKPEAKSPVFWAGRVWRSFRRRIGRRRTCAAGLRSVRRWPDPVA